MKISLVLSGGAARGAFHLGVLQAMDELGIKIEAISGSSIGAIIAASYASGISPKKQLELFKSKEFKKALKFNYFKSGLLKIDEKLDILKQLVPLVNIEESKIKLHISCIDLISGEVVYFDKGDAKLLCIASSALIPIFRPIEYQNYKLADGGIMDNLPVSPLKNYKNKVIGVDLHPMQYGCKNSVRGIIKRTLFLMWRASVSKHIKELDLYITDKQLSQYSLFTFKKLDKLFDLGYQIAKEHLDEFLKKEE